MIDDQVRCAGEQKQIDMERDSIIMALTQDYESYLGDFCLEELKDIVKSGKFEQ